MSQYCDVSAAVPIAPTSDTESSDDGAQIVTLISKEITIVDPATAKN